MMKIRRLVIDNFKGIDHLEMKELPDSGVIVISGDNEEGKSTIMDALDFIFNKVKKGSRVASAQPVGKNVGPCVTIELDAGKYALTMKKRWITNPEALLKIYRPEIGEYRDDAAVDRFLEIVRDSIDVELLRALFLRQNYIEPQLSAAGIPSLATVLNERTGVSGGRGTNTEMELIAVVDKEYDRYWTKPSSNAKKINPKKKLKEVEEELEEAQQRYNDAEEAARTLAGYIERMEKEQQVERETEVELPGARAKVDEREAEHIAAQEATRRRDASVEAVKEAQARLRRAEERLAARAELSEEVKRREATRDRWQTELEEAEEKAGAEKARVAELSEKVRSARQREEAARMRLKEARQASKTAEGRVRLAELDARLVEIRTRQEAVDRARKQLPEVPLRADALEEISRAREELAVARAVAEASRAKLRLRGPLSEQVLVDGEVLEWQADDAESSDSPDAKQEDLAAAAGSAQVPLSEGTRIRIGAVEATFTPGETAARGAGSGQDPFQRVAALEREYLGLLEQFGVEDIEQARALAERTTRAAAQLNEARRLLAEAQRGEDLNALSTERERLAAQLGSQAGSPSEDGGTAADGKLDPGETSEALGQARAALEAAEAEHESAQRERETAEMELAPWQDSPAAREFIGVKARFDSAAEELKEAISKRAHAQDELPLTELEAEETAARANHTERARQLEIDQKVLEEANPEEAEERYEGAKQKVRSLEYRASQAHAEIATLGELVKDARGAEEKAARLRAEFESAQFEHVSVRRRAEAVKTLSEALHRHQDSARRRYSEPFARELENLSRVVFGPDMSYQLDEELKVTKRNYRGTAIDVDQLSGGAKEQLMILTRLAVAQLAGGESGNLTVPVFLDDALGNTDPGRLERMGALLSRLGTSGQVFVLTCMPSRYDSVRGKVELPIDKLKSGSEAL